MIAKPIRMAAGKHGTPQFNPAPHPQAHPDAVAMRETDPLWQAHRGIDAKNAYPLSLHYVDRAEAYQPITYNQINRHALNSNITPQPPEGMHSWGNINLKHPAFFLTSRMAHGEPQGDLSPNHLENLPFYNPIWGFHNPGRRPWWNTVFPLQDLQHFGKHGDPYQLLAGSVLSGNRHALPFLVDTLKRRDNPAGWYPGWAALARRMEEQGDLPMDQVLRRLNGIASAAAETDTEHALTRAGREGGDLTPYMALNDALQEGDKPHWAQLLRTELANVIPSFRYQTKGRRRLQRPIRMAVIQPGQQTAQETLTIPVPSPVAQKPKQPKIGPQPQPEAMQTAAGAGPGQPAMQPAPRPVPRSIILPWAPPPSAPKQRMGRRLRLARESESPERKAMLDDCGTMDWETRREKLEEIG